MFDLRKALPILGLAAIAGILAIVWASGQPEQFQATAVVAVGPAGSIEEAAEVIDVVGTLDRGGIIATVAGVADSRSVRDAAIEQLGLVPSDFNGYQLTAIPVLESNLVDISVTGPEAQKTADLTNAVTEQLDERFTALYDIYRLDVVSSASVPDESGRPDAALVGLGAALVGALIGLFAVRAWYGQRSEDNSAPPAP